MVQMTRRQRAKAKFGCMAGAIDSPRVVAMASAPQEIKERNGSRTENVPHRPGIYAEILCAGNVGRCFT
jgi:hypothetical protein